MAKRRVVVRDAAYSVEHCMERLRERYPTVRVSVVEFNKFNVMAQHFVQKFLLLEGHERKTDASDKVSMFQVVSVERDRGAGTHGNINQLTLQCSVWETVVYAVFDVARNHVTTFLPPQTIKAAKTSNRKG